MKKVLIANRGEIACRVIRACRTLGLEAVAVYSDADKDSLHVELADQAVHVGPSSARESYLNVERILQAAKESGADAVHPGYGFLAENTGFARALSEAGLVWIGPSPKTIEDMGDKERARDIAKAAGVPVLPGSPRFSPGDLAGLEEAGREVGYPLLVKASAGGGGIGMRRVDGPEKLREVAEATQNMAAKAFGDGTIYMERLVASARHVEIQVFGFGDGRAVHFFERDCSVQRRFQKIIEESPAPELAAETVTRMGEAAVALCHHERYAGAGTVEFIFDAQSGEYFFLEMNTRIQVEHPVTEMVTGADLVAMQIEQAAGTLKPVEQSAIRREGHAIECRIYAENPDKNFMPSPGTLKTFDLAVGMVDDKGDVRVDTGYRAGDAITPFYDPMIAKLIVRGSDRVQAIERMAEVLRNSRIEGPKTNLGFLSRVMADEVFRAGGVTTGFVDQRMDKLKAA